MDVYYFQNNQSLKSYNHFKIRVRNTAVSTPGDLFFHIRADRQTLCYELGNIINNLVKVTYPIDEVHGFRYFDGRAIIGFRWNREPEPVAAQWALVGDEDPDFIGEVMLLSRNIHMIWINGVH